MDTTPEVNLQQVGGNHYRTAFQHWDFVGNVLGGRYLEGCATKYISRWRKKNGLEDLKKSAHYIAKLISLVKEDEALPPLHLSRNFYPNHAIEMFCQANDLRPDERSIMLLISDWQNIHDLEVALDMVNAMIVREQGIHDEIEQMRQDNP